MLDFLRTSRATIGDRVFNVSAARAWNSLTTAVQSSESLGAFCRRLKTELFTRSYSWHCLFNNRTAAWLIFTFPTAFAVAATLKLIFNYNVAMTFINNNNIRVLLLLLPLRRGFVLTLFSCRFVCLYLSRTMQKLLDQFHKIWWKGGTWATEEPNRFWW